METIVTRRLRALIGAFSIGVLLAPTGAVAQPAPQAPAPQSADGAAGSSRLWLVGGGALATLRGDCQTCEEDFPYRQSGSILVNFGYRVTDRMDVGAEVFWMPVETNQGRIRTTHYDAVAQFRPWASHGFFLKGGAGMAFVRNWVDAIGPEAINSKALSVVIGAGWAFQPVERFGFQIFGTQHAAAIGDLQTAGEPIPDVIGNFWSLGMAIVIR
jgi:hypothetical protein